MRCTPDAAANEADALRRQADQFVDIVELQPKISRDPTERAARETREPRHFLQRAHSFPRGEQRAALLQMAQVWQRLADEHQGQSPFKQEHDSR